MVSVGGRGVRVTDGAASRRDAMLDYLARQGGSVQSADGRGLTAPMAEALGYDNLAALKVMLTRMEKEGVIVRDSTGGRTFRIALAGLEPPQTHSPRHSRSPTQVGLAEDVARLQQAQSDLEGRFSAAEAALRQANLDFHHRLVALERSLAQAMPSRTRRWGIRRGEMR
jgi:hypothetical protein